MIDLALKPWLLTCREQGVTLSDTIIRQKAILVAGKKGMRGGGNLYQFSGGRKWLRTFKERFGIVDGVATRLGFTETELAREKAYGRFPLDESFWAALPDEDGNFVDATCIAEGEFDDMDVERHGHVFVYKVRQATSGQSTGKLAAPYPVTNPSDTAITPLIFPDAINLSFCGPSSSASPCTPDYLDPVSHPFAGSSTQSVSPIASPAANFSPSFSFPGALPIPFQSPDAFSVPSPPPNSFSPEHTSSDVAMLLPSHPDLYPASLSSSAFLESAPLAGPFNPLDMTTQSLDAASLSSMLGITCGSSLGSSSSGLFMSSPSTTTTPDMSVFSSPGIDSFCTPSPTNSSPAAPPSHPLLSGDSSMAHYWPSIDGDGTVPHTVEFLHGPQHLVSSSGDALANGMYQPPSCWPVFENDNFFMQKYAWSQTLELPRVHETSLGSYVDPTATQWSMWCVR